MKVKGLTIARMCCENETCQDCIFGKGSAPCEDLVQHMKATFSPDNFYKAMMREYELDFPEVEQEETIENDVNIKVMYHTCITPIWQKHNSDWIDLRAGAQYHIEAGESTIIHLGVSIKLPDGYEAIIAPRSSLFKNKGLLQTNGVGIIDNSYCGDNDIWGLPVFATRTTDIEFNERICQFRIQKKQPRIHFFSVDTLGGEDRGGFGSTGGYSNES